jgi:hypothetical protein
MVIPDNKGILIQYRGGLGNQLFQLATAFTAAQTYGRPLYLPQNPASNNPHNRFQQDYRNTVFSRLGERLEITDVETAEAILNVESSQYLPFDKIQTEFRRLILEGLSEQLEYVQTVFKPSDRTAFLHIRHNNCRLPLQYYRWCIADLLRRRPDIDRIFIFSDDIGWVQRHAFFSRPLFQIMNMPNELETLALMSCCGGGAICANSTFSLWGAFLSGSEIIYAPSDSNTELIPSTWTCVRPEMYRTEIQSADTVFVTLTDAGYFDKAKRTIQETRGRGGWGGDIVLITVNFIAAGTDAEFMRKYRVQEFPVQHINTDALVAALRATPIKAMPDGRHFGKLTQWDKIYSFSPFFRRWRRVAFLDAGIRILDSVQPLLNLQWEGRFLAPDDSEPFDNGNRFRCQLDLEANPAVLTELLTEYPQSILDEKYFLNCMYVYDTAILDSVKMDDMIAAMNAYPISLCNEMGIMNLIVTFKHRLWSAFPHRTSEGKYLFGWNERNYPEGPTWESFHFMKYPATT